MINSKGRPAASRGMGVAPGFYLVKEAS